MAQSTSVLRVLPVASLQGYLFVLPAILLALPPLVASGWPEWRFCCCLGLPTVAALVAARIFSQAVGLWSGVCLSVMLSFDIASLIPHEGPTGVQRFGGFLAKLLPWLLLAPATWRECWTRAKENRLERKSLAWIALSLPCGFAISFALPDWSGLGELLSQFSTAVLTAILIRSGLSEKRAGGRLLLLSMTFASVCGLAVFLYFSRSPNWPSGQLGLERLGLGGVVLAVASLLGVAFLRRRQQGLAIRAFVIGATAVTWSTIFHGL